jgi:hypothetical protein
MDPPDFHVAVRFLTKNSKNDLRRTGPAITTPPVPHGALAQLVEHLHGMQGVSGSNPLRSTILPR